MLKQRYTMGKTSNWKYWFFLFSRRNWNFIRTRSHSTIEDKSLKNLKDFKPNRNNKTSWKQLIKSLQLSNLPIRLKGRNFCTLGWPIPNRKDQKLIWFHSKALPQPRKVFINHPIPLHKADALGSTAPLQRKRSSYAVGGLENRSSYAYYYGLLQCRYDHKPYLNHPISCPTLSLSSLLYFVFLSPRQVVTDNRSGFPPIFQSEYNDISNFEILILKSLLCNFIIQTTKFGIYRQFETSKFQISNLTSICKSSFQTGGFWNRLNMSFSLFETRITYCRHNISNGFLFTPQIWPPWSSFRKGLVKTKHNFSQRWQR